MKEYFYCYSPRLKRALLSNGFRYVCVGVNCRTDARFWLFEATEELNDYKTRVYPKERDEF